MGRIRIHGNKDENGRLTSVTFSNRSGGAFTLKVGSDEHREVQQQQQVVKKTTLCEFLNRR